MRTGGTRPTITDHGLFCPPKREDRLPQSHRIQATRPPIHIQYRTQETRKIENSASVLAIRHCCLSFYHLSLPPPASSAFESSHFLAPTKSTARSNSNNMRIHDSLTLNMSCGRSARKSARKFVSVSMTGTFPCRNFT